MEQKLHVVIVGGGFGGLAAARALRHAPVKITLIDKRNYNLFQPLLYQVATATLNPSNIATPLRTILRRQKNVSVILAEATSVRCWEKKLILSDGEISYDYLILAPGATTSYFGHESWAPHAPSLKGIEDALEIRRRVFLAYEKAEREQDLKSRSEWLTFAVIGAGPTGVELAGALAEISRHTLIHEFRNINPSDARIVLIEGAAHVLPAFPIRLSRKVEKALGRLGVEIRTNAQVTHMDKNGVTMGTERIPARTIIWAAGVRASPIAQSLGTPLDPSGRVVINPDLTLPGHPNIFVIGDLAALQQNGKLIPGVAPAAMQEGRHAACNIQRALRGQSYEPFIYIDKGMMAAIGRGVAITYSRHFQLSGFAAWVVWLLLHIYLLIGFKNRLMVMLEWGWHYMKFWRGARLITGNGALKNEAHDLK